MKQTFNSRNLVFFGSNIKESENTSSVNYVPIQGTKIPFGFAESEVTFDPEEMLGYVLVKKKAFSCNYREQAYILSLFPFLTRKGADDDKVYFLSFGSEFSAEVVTVGSAVKELKPGDHVIGNGNYSSDLNPGESPGLPTNNASSEYDIFHHSKLMKYENLEPEYAAGFSLGAQTSYSMVRKMNVVPGSRVLITACSSNTSIFIINALKHKGCELIGLSRSPHHNDKLLEMGLDKIVNGDYTSIKQQLNEEVNENGFFSHVFDPFLDLYLTLALDVLDMGGKYTTCGIMDQFSGVQQNVEPKTLSYSELSKFFLKNIQLIGNCLGTTSDLNRALKDAQNQKLEYEVDSIYAENDLKSFINRSFNDAKRFGKVVYKF